MKNWKEIETHAEHYKALGINRVYLSKYDGWDGEYPWHLATSVEEGGTHRLDISTDLRFSCQLEGIEVTWAFDLESHSANGSSEYHINSDGVTEIIGNLNPDCLNALKQLLAADSQKVKARAEDYMKAAQKQYGDAAILERLSR